MYFLHIFLIVLIKKYMFITCLKNTYSFYMWFVKNIFMHRVFSWIITIKQLFFVVVKWMGLKLKVISKGNILKTTLSRTAFPLSHSLSLSLSLSMIYTRRRSSGVLAISPPPTSCFGCFCCCVVHSFVYPVQTVFVLIKFYWNFSG
jgi:hypothetical protein